jgi:hypothetical protein
MRIAAPESPPGAEAESSSARQLNEGPPHPPHSLAESWFFPETEGWRPAATGPERNVARRRIENGPVAS